MTNPLLLRNALLLDVTSGEYLEGDLSLRRRADHGDRPPRLHSAGHQPRPAGRRAVHRTRQLARQPQAGRSAWSHAQGPVHTDGLAVEVVVLGEHDDQARVLGGAR